MTLKSHSRISFHLLSLFITVHLVIVLEEKGSVEFPTFNNSTFQ